MTSSYSWNIRRTSGDRSTLAIMHSLVAHDAVLLPFGENTRYDLVIDTGATFERIQCKTGRLKSGVVIFATASTYAHHPNPKIHRRGYENEIEYFGVYYPTNGGVYLVPISDVSTTTSAILRIEPTRNRQSRGVRFANRYEIARVETRLREARLIGGAPLR
jgi:hypothetical protein